MFSCILREVRRRRVNIAFVDKVDLRTPLLPTNKVWSCGSAIEQGVSSLVRPLDWRLDLRFPTGLACIVASNFFSKPARLWWFRAVALAGLFVTTSSSTAFLAWRLDLRDSYILLLNLPQKLDQLMLWLWRYKGEWYFIKSGVQKIGVVGILAITY
jgi:hypothetical protein